MTDLVVETEPPILAPGSAVASHIVRNSEGVSW